MSSTMFVGLLLCLSLPGSLDRFITDISLLHLEQTVMATGSFFSLTSNTWIDPAGISHFFSGFISEYKIGE